MNIYKKLKTAYDDAWKVNFLINYYFSKLLCLKNNTTEMKI